MLYGSRNLLIDSSCYNPLFIADQLLAVQYKKITAKSPKRLYHIIVSMDMNIEGSNNYGYHMNDRDLKRKNVYFLMNLGNKILDLYPDYQSFFAVHEDKEHLHMHIVFNNCPIYPEKKNLTYCYNHLQIQRLVDSFVDCEIGLRDMVEF
mgnify:CR=1 FL=1